MSAAVSHSAPSDPKLQFHTRRPSVDVYENDQHYLLKFDVPGADAETVNVELEEGVLQVSAPQGPTELVRGPVRLRYERRLSLPTKVRQEDIQAELKDGVLVVTAPKDVAQILKVPVTVH